MSRAGNDREYLRTINMNHLVYTINEDGEFTSYSDDNFYAQKTLAEVIGVDNRTRRYSSKADDRKRKRNRKDTKTKGRCHNKSYKLSDNRFKKNGGSRTNG